MVRFFCLRLKWPERGVNEGFGWEFLHAFGWSAPVGHMRPLAGLGWVCWMLRMGRTVGQSDRGATCGASWLCDPFCRRVQRVIASWIEGEWERRERLSEEAKALGWTAQRRRAYLRLTLTPDVLAEQIEHISESKLRRKLRRELARLGAPTPGRMIRDARMA